MHSVPNPTRPFKLSNWYIVINLFVESETRNESETNAKWRESQTFIYFFLGFSGRFALNVADHWGHAFVFGSLMVKLIQISYFFFPRIVNTCVYVRGYFYALFT